MKQMDKDVEHRSAAKEAKKNKMCYNDSSSDDEDYQFGEKKDRKGAMMTPVKDAKVWGGLLNNMKSNAHKTAIRGMVDQFGD